MRRPSGERINTPVSATACENQRKFKTYMNKVFPSFDYRMVFISSVLDTIMQIWTGSTGHEQAQNTVRNAAFETHEMASICHSAVVRRSTHQVFVHSLNKKS
jgi:hypothetical protein